MPVRMQNYLFNDYERETLSVCCWGELGGGETSISGWKCGDPSYAAKNSG